MKRALLIWLAGSMLVPLFSRGAEPGISDPASNAICLSYGGAGIYYSLTYERLLLAKPAHYLGVRTGIGASLSRALWPEFNIPAGGYYLYGRKPSKLDLGIAATGYFMRQFNDAEESHRMELNPLIVPSLAYRYQKKSGGLLIRAGLSAVINLNRWTNTYTPWIDLGVGYAF